MKVGENNRLILEASDGLTYRFELSPNTEKGVLTPKNLIIHSTEGPDVQSAVNTFKSVSGGKSVHLILGRDGKEVVQMLDFNMKGIHANEYNQNSLGIELDYTGHLRDDEKVKHHFAYIGNFKQGEYIYARTMNEGDQQPLRPFPRYPKEQMEALVKISRTLVQQYGLKIFGHEEIKSFKLDPGPAFPMNKFRETVFGNAEGAVVLDETLQEVDLRTGPNRIYPLIPESRLKIGTPVSIVGDHDGWALVEVIAEVGGNPWLVGWIDLDLIGAKRAMPVVKNHKLHTTDGRQYKYIPAHPNGYDANRKLIEPKYVVMHMTGGITMQSTINWFRNESSEVAAHLLIGRDGRVVQFVDFDTPAHHCGFSYWEEDFDLNRYSIGIELDNGANLSHLDGVWKWKTTVIPDEEVQSAQYWKNNSPLG